MYLLALLVPISTYIMYKLYHVHIQIKIVANLLNKKYPVVLFSLSKTYLFSLYIRSLQVLQQNVRCDAGVYQLSFVIEGQLCYFLVKMKRGPKKTFTVFDEDQKDVTSEMAPFIHLQLDIVDTIGQIKKLN